MAADPDDELLTIAEAAKLLKVSTVTIHRWVKQGRLPAYQVGPRCIRIRRSDLARMLAPIERPEVVGAAEGRSPNNQVFIAPPTDEEVQRRLQAIQESEKSIQEMLARRGGKPFPSSWQLIRESREERSERQ